MATEFHVYLTNCEGKPAAVPWFRLLSENGATADSTVRLALSKGCEHFNVDRMDDSPDGCSLSRSREVRFGKLVKSVA